MGLRHVCGLLAGHIWTDAQGSVLGKAVDIVTGLQVLGRDKVEKALPVGTNVTVVGELVSAEPAVCSTPA